MRTFLRGLAALGVVVVVTAFVFAVLALGSERLIPSPWVVAIISTGISALVFALVIYSLYRLLRLGLDLLLSAVRFDELAPAVVLVSLAVAATLFPDAAASVWLLLYGLLRLAFLDFPRSVVDVALSSYACGETISRFDGTSSECLVRILAGGATTIGRFFDSLLAYLRGVVSILQFFGAWAVLVSILGGLVGQESSWAHRLLNSITPAGRRQLGLGAVIIVAAYFSLCAIVSVSLFKPTDKLVEPSKSDLQARFDPAKLPDTGPDSAFAKRFPDALADFPSLTGATTQSLSYASNEYADLAERWRQLRSDVASEQDRLARLALTAYEIQNLNRVGSREQANHFAALTQWYQVSLRHLFANLDNCRFAIGAFRSGATALIAGRSPTAESIPVQGGAPASMPNAISPIPSPIISSFSAASFDPFSASLRARTACELRVDDLDPLPDRGNFGYTLGIIGTLVGWLLRTESMPLALITGLVGFGLFGALVSTYIRTPPEQVSILGVLWRGLSAAMVVFLAAYGGIAVVSQTSTDPNPYVVFVTCLVGAVFGDDVWLWAKGLLPKPATTDAGEGTRG